MASTISIHQPLNGDFSRYSLFDKTVHVGETGHCMYNIHSSREKNLEKCQTDFGLRSKFFCYYLSNIIEKE